MDPLDGIAAFARLVDSGSFSAAARRLKISESAVRAHVHRLEERLGIRLLNRTTRRLSVTEAGAAYYRHCARILAEAEAAEQTAGPFVLTAAMAPVWQRIAVRRIAGIHAAIRSTSSGYQTLRPHCSADMPYGPMTAVTG